MLVVKVDYLASSTRDLDNRRLAGQYDINLAKTRYSDIKEATSVYIFDFLGCYANISCSHIFMKRYLYQTSCCVEIYAVLSHIDRSTIYGETVIDLRPLSMCVTIISRPTVLYWRKSNLFFAASLRRLAYY